MSAAGRLGLYAAGLAATFAAAFGIAAAAVPESAVEARMADAVHAEGAIHSEETMEDHDAMEGSADDAPPPGLAIAAHGFTLSPVTAPPEADRPGELSFRILDAHGEPLTRYVRAHEKDLHLIVVRSDGTQFRHTHPSLDPATGTWSLPWQWAAAGTYRVYADFTPDVEDATGVTLSRSVDVAGHLDPAPPTSAAATDLVDGFDVTIAGQLTAGAASELTVTVARDGHAVTDLEPYLGAFGHLVALRDGDLAYLHVHAEGDEPTPGEIAGPDIAFTAHVPTAGRYRLYLDFQVDGQVHTAEFVLDASPGTGDDTPAHGH